MQCAQLSLETEALVGAVVRIYKNEGAARKT